MQFKPATEERTLKIVFLGNSGVGKTTIIQRYVSSNFQENPEATIGSMYFAKDIRVNEHNFNLEVKKNFLKKKRFLTPRDKKDSKQ